MSVPEVAIEREIDADTFHADVRELESLWRPMRVGGVETPVIELGPASGAPLVFVPILEHLEFVYARQMRALAATRRVILYRRAESRTRSVGLAERAEELGRVLDALGLESADLVGHGDAAMTLFEFAARHPRRCRSLVIIAQGADYQIAPHPWIWLLHEVFLRAPAEYVLPAGFLRRIVINYIVARKPETGSPDAAPAASHRLPRALIDEQFRKIAAWPRVYKFSVLSIIHYFDMRRRLDALTMPILLINRADDALAPERRTRWLAERLPQCAGYHVVPGAERFFMYSQPEPVTALIEAFLARSE
jgi:pimeloyl-ACP methyl ester carboxylesterase